jgi:four helix bundle protein
MRNTSGYRDLLAWQEAMRFVVMVYHVTARFPREEVYGLTAQIRRAAASIPSNIAEGAARNSPREFHQFLGVSAGSLAEVETQLDLAARLNYVKPDRATALQAQKVGMLLEGLRRSCKRAS